MNQKKHIRLPEFISLDDPSVEDTSSMGIENTEEVNKQTWTTVELQDDDQNNTTAANGGAPGETDVPKDLLLNASNFFEYDPDEHQLEEELGFEDPSDPPTPGCNLKFLQWKTRRFVEHFLIRILTALLILIDMIILIIDLSNDPSDFSDPLEFCSLAFSTYFMIEVLLRLFALGPYYFFRAWYNFLDFVLVASTFIMSIVTVSAEDVSSNPASLIVVLRLVRLIRITRILWQRRQLQTGARQFISQNKRRYQKDGFDLDLTYVTPKVIAMSFPSSGRMSMYRNDIRDVSRFLDTKHPSHYKIYNLCSERHYDESFFHNRVERFFIHDHNVPSIVEMLEFSTSVEAWLSTDSKNIFAVHCKGGKGRTGTMICVFLIDSGVFQDASHCLGFFGDRRTDTNAGKKFQGVETPSQSRYVGYYEEVVLRGRQTPPETLLYIVSFSIMGLSSVGGGTGEEFYVTIQSRCHPKSFQAGLNNVRDVEKNRKPDEDLTHIVLKSPVPVKGDTKVMFLANSMKIPRGYDNCPFYFWFHTGFIQNNSLTLERSELDNPHKSKTWHVFQENFSVNVAFKQGS